nr:kiwellin-like [Ipomoea batatas]
MANLALISLSIFAIFVGFSLQGNALSDCNGPCTTLNDCSGELICIGGKCTDDPDVGTHICGGGGGSTPTPGDCEPVGSMTCNGETKPTYQCSPPVTSSTAATLTLNDFSEGGDGGAPSECDGQFHDNDERVVALSTGWYSGGSRCGRTIRITASNGRSTTAKVVDECDSMHGCDDEHAGQVPCDNNIVDGSAAVWDALGLDQDLGRVPVTWAMA